LYAKGYCPGGSSARVVSIIQNCCRKKPKLTFNIIQYRYARNWRYHKELGLWLTKETDENGRPVQAFRRTSPNALDRGVYVFFDPTTWQKVKREWTLSWDAIEERSQPPTQPSSLPNSNNGTNNASNNGSNRVMM
jgi:CCR4-NOT transcription complex subunit 2